MTVVAFTIVNPNPGVKWEDVQKLIKKGCDLARKHGAENFTVLVMTLGGRATNTIGVLSSAVDWGVTPRSSARCWRTPKCRPSCKKVASWPPGSRTSARRSLACNAPPAVCRRSPKRTEITHDGQGGVESR